MSDGLKFHPFFRSAESNVANTCDGFTYREDWAGQADDKVVGGFQCGGQNYALVKKGNNLVVKKGATEIATFSSNEDVYFAVDATDKEPKVFKTRDDTVGYFESKRKPEVAKEEKSTVKLEGDELLRVGGGVGYSTAKETTPLPVGLQGEVSSHDGREMNGIDLSGEATLFWSRLLPTDSRAGKLARNWLSPIGVGISGGYGYGWLNDHYTADEGNSGYYQRWAVSLDLNFQLSVRFFEKLFTGHMGDVQERPKWDIFADYRMPIIGYEGLEGNWAHSGGSIPKDVDTGRLLYPGQIHKVSLGFRVDSVWGMIYYIHDTGLGEKPTIDNNIIGLGAGWSFGGPEEVTKPQTIDGDKTVRLDERDATVEKTPQPVAVSMPVREPVAAIPEKRVLKAHEPIFIPAALKFKHKSNELLPGEEEKLAKIIEDIKAALNKEYPDGIPEGYVLYLTAVGKASPEGALKNNQALSGARAKPTATLLFQKLKELKEKGEEPFKNLVIEEKNFDAKGVGEMELVQMDGEKVVEIKRPYGGYENDNANRTPAKGNVYKVCVGSSDPKISYKNCGEGTVVDVDMELNRRLDIKIDVGPPKAASAAAAEGNAGIAGADKVEAEKVVKGITESPLYKDSNGFKKVYYDKDSNSIVIVLNKQGFENRDNLVKGYTTKAKKKIPGLYDVVKGIKDNPASKLSGNCTIRFVAFYPEKGEAIDTYLKMLNDTFYSGEDAYSNWPFNAATPTFDLIQTEYDSKSAPNLVSQRIDKEKARMLDEGLQGSTFKVGPYKVAWTMVDNLAALKPEEAEMLDYYVRERSKEGKVTLYIASKSAPSQADADKIVERARRINTGIADYYAAADPNVVKGVYYIIVISGADAPDLSSKDNQQMIELRKEILKQVFMQ